MLCGAAFCSISLIVPKLTIKSNTYTKEVSRTGTLAEANARSAQGYHARGGSLQPLRALIEEAPGTHGYYCLGEQRQEATPEAGVPGAPSPRGHPRKPG